MSVKRVVGKVTSESLGIVFLTTGVNLVLQGDYATGIFLIVLGIACLFAEKIIPQK